jgi:hypothetical protein
MRRGSHAPRAMPHDRAAEALVLVSSYLCADTRLIAAAVCRAWRAALDDPSLWLTLQLSPSCAAPPEAPPRDALLAAAAARARGGLTALDVRACERLTSAALADVLRANAGALERVDVTCGASERVMAAPALRELLSACGPRLRAFITDVEVKCLAEAAPLLAGAPPFGALHCRCLRVSDEGAGGEEPSRYAWSEADVVALAAGIATGPGGAHLAALNLTGVQLPVPALDALVDAALARRVRQLHFSVCGLDARSEAPLVRLLDGGAVTDLLLFDCRLDRNGVDGAVGGEALFRAIARCRSLRTLYLAHTTVSLHAHCWLVPHCVRHPSLQSLTLYECHAQPGALSDAVGALLRANAPALRTLRVVLKPSATEDQTRIDASLLAFAVGRTLRAASPLTTLALAPAPPAGHLCLWALLDSVRAATRLRQLELGGSAYEVEAAEEQGVPVLHEEAAALVRYVEERARASPA